MDSTQDESVRDMMRRGFHRTTAAERNRNKEVVRRMLRAFSDGTPEVVDELTTPDLISHSPHPLAAFHGKEQERLKAEIELPRTAFPDQRFEEQVMIAEGDLVFVGWKLTGSHQGPLADREATGKEFEVTGGEVVRLRDGKIVEHVDHYSKPRFELLAKLGILDDRMLEWMQNRGLI
jgi:ketosteroid isomerase-like protein